MSGQRPTLDHVVGTREDGQAVVLTGAEHPIPIADWLASVRWLGFDTQTISTAALKIPAAIRNNEVAMITVETAIVRIRVEGGAPTASVGHDLRPGDIAYLTNKDELTRWQAIRKDAVDATLTITVGVRLL